MPEKGWNGKLLGTGNGGFAGSIYYEQMGGYLARGYATAGTDTGHQAEAEDASWAYHHPEKITDFGYRGLHLTTLRAKSLLQDFYGNAPRKSYFDSCSDGGREALMEAQRFPDDYDGILAGAPANDWTHLVSAGLDVGKTLDGNPAAYISSMKLPAITRAVLAACDAEDGLKDGILNDPRQCHFNPETLLCKGADAIDCLTAPQITALKKLYSGGQTSDGKTISPGLMPGDESAWKAWAIGSAPGMSNYTQNYFRYMILDDPQWNGFTADVDASLKEADEKTARILNATDPDLSRFAAHGGKLILYHGWNDPAISPLNTISYYGSVGAKLGEQKEASFVRLYMAPGMEHCAGGPGPSAFGQLGIPSAKGEKYGAFTALEDWVEAGKVPGEIIATRYSAPGKVQMTRPLCPYPQVAKYNGTGDADDAASFACVAP
jgi:feruloyl esterase